MCQGGRFMGFDGYGGGGGKRRVGMTILGWDKGMNFLNKYSGLGGEWSDIFFGGLGELRGFGEGLGEIGFRLGRGGYPGSGKDFYTLGTTACRASWRWFRGDGGISEYLSIELDVISWL